MATWHGTPKKFSLEVYDPKDFGYSHYEDVEFAWEYSTVSDILEIQETDSFGTTRNLYGKERAEALLYTLAQWYSRYKGEKSFKALLEEFLKKQEE